MVQSGGKAVTAVKQAQQMMDAQQMKEEQQNMKKKQRNKYAIHAYTHGPVTGSGPSVKPLSVKTHLLVASAPCLGS